MDDKVYFSAALNGSPFSSCVRAVWPLCAASVSPLSPCGVKSYSSFFGRMERFSFSCVCSVCREREMRILLGIIQSEIEAESENK